MATEAQTCAIGNLPFACLPRLYFLLSAIVALHLSRVLYKSTLFMQNKPNLLNAQMNVTSFYTKDYENQGRLRTPPKQTQYKPNTNPIQTQYKANTNPIPERPKMNENSFATKVYENITTFRLKQNKPNTNPIKPNFKRDAFFRRCLRFLLPTPCTFD